MNENKAHWSFWFISSLLFLWNVMGCVNFLVQMNPDMVSTYRETEQAIILGRPLWATAGFAISVFGGAVGCVLLLLRSTYAFNVFLVSFVGTLIAIGHPLRLNINFGIGEIVGIIAMPVLVSAVLIWYAKYAQGKGWVKQG